MKRIIIATYERKSTLPHYCKSAWAYAEHIVKIECCFDDRSDERKVHAEDGMVTYRYNPKTKEKEEIPIEELFADLYTVITTNAAGAKVSYSYKTKEEANETFVKLKSKFKGWLKL